MYGCSHKATIHLVVWQILFKIYYSTSESQVCNCTDDDGNDNDASKPPGEHISVKNSFNTLIGVNVDSSDSFIWLSDIASPFMEAPSFFWYGVDNYHRSVCVAMIAHRWVGRTSTFDLDIQNMFYRREVSGNVFITINQDCYGIIGTVQVSSPFFKGVPGGRNSFDLN